jgi:catechol 2,3-dioxygenase-like lactoylglutathione lyase family enzyme
MFQAFQVNAIVQDMAPCVAFYAALGFVETYRFPDEVIPEHVEVRANGLTLGISSVDAAREVHGLAITGAADDVHICLWCADIDTAYATNFAAGSRMVREPQDIQDGRLRSGLVRDPGGNLVELVEQRG